MMKLVLRVALSLVVLSALAVPAWALKPEQVAVVANAKSADSLAVAELYMMTRGIPAGNLIRIETTIGYEASRKEYDSQIAEPIRKALTDRKLNDSITCLALMWGVPVRVAGEPPERARTLQDFYVAAAQKAHYSLAVDHALLLDVGEKFPEPQVEGLEPLGKVFGGTAAAPAEPLPSIEELNVKIAKLIDLKVKRLAELTDAQQKSIASRQLLAVVLDVYGRDGFVKFLEKIKSQGAPAVEAMKKESADAKQALEKVLAQRLNAELAAQELQHVRVIGGNLVVAMRASQQAVGLKSSSASDASVDSELALLWWGDYDLISQRPNMLYWRTAARAKDQKNPPTLMTARIDGPTSADAKRIINDSLAAEKSGLSGVLYIDAGGKEPAYDANLRALARLVSTNVADSRMKVVLDESNALFKPDACPDAALYVGWYSLRKYVPSFTWKQGAVGWHIASFEAMHLRDPKSEEWCPRMIQSGVAATIGAVNEPYLMAFPVPQEFFGLLLTGKYTLAECYWRTMPSASWRLTLIGDPLYNPFADKPLLNADMLPTGLAE